MNGSKKHSVALVLAGGGALAGGYEIGALSALDRWIAEGSVADADLFIGTSAGSIIGALLAAGISTAEIRTVIAQAAAVGGELGPNKVFQANVRALMRKSRHLAQLAMGRGSFYLRNMRSFCSLDLIWELLEGLPGGLYSTRRLELFIARTLADRGISTFGDLRRRLLVIASELETGEQATFGSDGLDDVPVARAIAASISVPMVVEPVKINGRTYIDGMIHGIAGLDLAVEAGATLVICVNPLVPLDARSTGSAVLRDASLQTVGAQSIRGMFYHGLHQQLKLLRRCHPEVTFVMLEPRRDDVKIFERPFLSGLNSQTLIDHAFQTTSAQIAERYDELSPVFAAHGMPLTEKLDLSLERPDNCSGIRHALRTLEMTLAALASPPTPLH